jgi:orotate phosphoribosyltransferase
LENFEESRKALVTHLRTHALRTDGPFVLASGEVSDWYVDGRQTTFDGAGARLVGTCVATMLDREVTAVGGMTMGADPIAVATAVMAPRPLKAFSVRKTAKDHGTGGRLVGPVGPGDHVAVVEDATTTGASAAAAIAALRDEGITVIQAITLVDRSYGVAAALMDQLGVPFRSVVTLEALGVE